MYKKKKFNPAITRVKLNPEQAVLLCACYQSTVWNESVTNKGTSYSACTQVGGRPFSLRAQCVGTVGTAGFRVDGSTATS